MHKEKEHETPQEQEYFFPNDGGSTAYACKAKNQDEAIKLNEAYLKSLKENS